MQIFIETRTACYDLSFLKNFTSEVSVLGRFWGKELYMVHKYVRCITFENTDISFRNIIAIALCTAYKKTSFDFVKIWLTKLNNFLYIHSAANTQTEKSRNAASKISESDILMQT